MAQAVLKNEIASPQSAASQETASVPQPHKEVAQIWPARRRWTREEFEKAGTLGIFGPEERLELIGGEIVEKMTQNSPHATAINLTAECIHAILTGGFHLRLQEPLNLGDSQPEPDVALVTGKIRDYAQQHPTTALLIVEVSDTTLSFDRLTKASLYAQADIADYWVLNLTDRVLEVHRNPAPLSGYPFGHFYRSITTYPDTASIAPLATPDQAIVVADLLP